MPKEQAAFARIYDYINDYPGTFFDEYFPLTCFYFKSENQLQFRLDLDALKTFVSGNNPEIEGEHYSFFGNLSSLNQSSQDLLVKQGLGMGLVLNTETIKRLESEN